MLGRTGALFAGIGGFELALEACGVQSGWACDSDPFARDVLGRRFGGETLHDVRDIDAGTSPVEFLSGGFPCQDLSVAGRGGGLDGERSGLWSEYARVIGLLRPRVVFVENVPRLLRLHFGRLLRDLRELGYNAEWDVISAAAVGAPHLRERLWIVAYEDEREVFGHPTGLLPIATVDGDDDRAWPRAGRMRGSEVWELVPLAPTSEVRAGRVLLPTPVAHDDGKTPQAHMAMKARMPGGARQSITSLSVLARNGFRQADGSLMLPTPRASDADRGGRGDLIQAVRGNPSPSGHFRFPTPVARDWKGEGMECQLGTVAARGAWPTPTAADGRGGAGGGEAMQGGDSLRTAVARWPTPLASMAADGQGGGELHRRVNHDPPWATPTAHPRTHDPRQVDHGAQIANQAAGPLNPTWIEWLMGFPLGWTDLTVENEELEMRAWDDEPLPRVRRDVSRRRERLTALGNAIVWPCALAVVSRALAFEQPQEEAA